MSRAVRGGLAVLSVGAVAGFVTASGSGSGSVAASASAGDEPIVVKLTAGSAERPGHYKLDDGIAAVLSGPPPAEKLTHRGDIEVDGKRWTLWLPEAKRYSLVNHGERDDDLFNDATLLSIDADGDGRLDDVENWFANLPVRIGDSMFDVKAIAADGSSLTLEKSKSPLRGLVIGRRVPPFELTTENGAKVSDATLAGKPYVLDIWSVT